MSDEKELKLHFNYLLIFYSVERELLHQTFSVTNVSSTQLAYLLTCLIAGLSGPVQCTFFLQWSWYFQTIVQKQIKGICLTKLDFTTNKVIFLSTRASSNATLCANFSATFYVEIYFKKMWESRYEHSSKASKIVVNSIVGRLN